MTARRKKTKTRRAPNVRFTAGLDATLIAYAMATQSHSNIGGSRASVTSNTVSSTSSSMVPVVIVTQGSGWCCCVYLVAATDKLDLVNDIPSSVLKMKLGWLVLNNRR